MPADYCENYRSKAHKYPNFNRTNNSRITNSNDERNWTQRYGLNAKALREVHVLIEDIIRRLNDRGYFLGDEKEISSKFLLARFWLSGRLWFF